jgi:predicted protein tyrosine phosphatase
MSHFHAVMDDQPLLAQLPSLHPRLWIGDQTAARCKGHEFDVVLSVLTTAEHRRARICHGDNRMVALSDRGNNEVVTFYTFAQAVGAGVRHVQTALDAGATILVHCHMGINRSAAVVVAAAVLLFPSYRNDVTGAMGAVRADKRVATGGDLWPTLCNQRLVELLRWFAQEEPSAPLVCGHVCLLRRVGERCCRCGGATRGRPACLSCDSYATQHCDHACDDRREGACCQCRLKMQWCQRCRAASSHRP